MLNKNTVILFVQRHKNSLSLHIEHYQNIIQSHSDITAIFSSTCTFLFVLLAFCVHGADGFGLWFLLFKHRGERRFSELLALLSFGLTELL